MKGKVNFKYFILLLNLSLMHIIAYSQTAECKENLQRAENFFAEAQYENAIIEYTKVIERSNYYDAYYGRGICYFMTKNSTKALADLYNAETSLEHMADTSFFWYRGQSHHRLDHYEWAYKNYLQAELNGMSTKDQLGLSLGTVCYFLGLTEQAYVYLNYYLNNNEGVEGAWTNLGWIYLEKEKVDSAEYAFEKAFSIEKSTNDDTVKIAKCLNNLGYAQGLNGNFEKGLESIRQSIDLNGNNSFAYRNIAYLYMKHGNKAKACKNLQIAIDMKIQEDWGKRYITELQLFCE